MANLLRSHHLGLRNYPVSYRHSADCQAEYVKYSAVWEPCHNQSPVHGIMGRRFPDARRVIVKEGKTMEDY